MAIYSLSHSAIGRTTHDAGTAGAHITYITRSSACTGILNEFMPHDGDEAKAWMDAQETGDRKNARVIDKVMVALPKELDQAGQFRLVNRFVHEVAGYDNVPWLAAFHTKGKDAHNPHAHIVIRDRHRETGKRVAELSSKGSTERLRELWEKCANESLKEAQQEVRIDRRSLKEQGIERTPQIHKGAKVKAMQQKGIRPTSKVRKEVTIRGKEREINYPVIDKGKTRTEHNSRIISYNKFQALPNNYEQLNKVFEEEVRQRELKIQQRARAIAVKVQRKLKMQEGRNQAHTALKPKPPEFLKTLRQSGYEKQLAKWKAIAKALANRYQSLKKRLVKVLEYTSETITHYDEKAKVLAKQQVKKELPELTFKHNHHRALREEERIRKLNLEFAERQKQQELNKGKEHELSLERDRGLSR